MAVELTEITQPPLASIRHGFEAADGQLLFISEENRLLTFRSGRWFLSPWPPKRAAPTRQLACICVLASHADEPVDGEALCDAIFELVPETEARGKADALRDLGKWLRGNVGHANKHLKKMFGLKEPLQKVSSSPPKYRFVGRALSDTELAALVDPIPCPAPLSTDTWAREESERVATGLSEFTNLGSLTSLLLLLPCPRSDRGVETGDADAWGVLQDLTEVLQTRGCPPRQTAAVIDALVVFSFFGPVPLELLSSWSRERTGSGLPIGTLAAFQSGSLPGIERCDSDRFRLDPRLGLKDIRSASALDFGNRSVRRSLSRCIASSRCGADAVLPGIYGALFALLGFFPERRLSGRQALDILKHAAEDDSDQAAVLLYLVWHILTRSPHYAAAARREQAHARELATAAAERGSTAAAALIALTDSLGPMGRSGGPQLRLWQAANAEDAARPRPTRWQDFVARAALVAGVTGGQVKGVDEEWVASILRRGVEARIPFAALELAELLFRRDDPESGAQCLEEASEWTPMATHDLAVELFVGSRLDANPTRAVELLRARKKINHTILV